MVFTQEQKIFIVESYFRNGHLVVGVCQYSIQSCFVEFRQQFPDAVLTHNTFQRNLTYSIQLFCKIRSVDKKCSGCPKKK
ncbi:hypothetical protein BDFB_014289 [Asbolus verrucosus]|uniref:Uncharacterized protein n=1 Tax=Asbolus verrucosus TaxID=1661398 RepID=A0A482VG57_ASBVE|nr:hypothetical protein BDFB_014289 [Asbolus verrucosus]